MLSRGCLTLCAAACFVLGSCHPATRMQETEIAITRFHKLADDGHFEALYDLASPEFRRNVKLPVWVGMLARIQRKMGVCRDSLSQSWLVESNTSGSFVRVSVRRNCTAGVLEENFRWQVKDGGERLFAYGANSRALLTDSCLSGCLSRPQLVVWGRAQAAVPEEPSRVPNSVRHRGGLPAVLGEVPVA
jgi:hypothetical protein